MKAIVLFESMFGNTRHVAEAIADGLRWSMPTDVVAAHDPGGLDLAEVELVVVGAPTHAWGLGGKRTRQGAAQDAAKHPDHLLDGATTDAGIREWLNEVTCANTCRGVSFDTRLDKPQILTGSAARSIQRRLRSVGFATFDRPHSFRVTGMAGPLAAGEIERAAQWGEAMGRTIVPLTARTLTPSRTAR
jgi:Flavodoxin domain